MRRFVPLLVAGAAMIAAACRDAIAPTRSVSEATLVARPGDNVAARGGRDADRRPSPGTDVYTALFAIPAAGGTVRVGDFWLTFPASSVCDPATSGYGKHTWDNPCTSVNYDFDIIATYWWENGEAYVEFFPDIRFNPNTPVYISTYRPALVGKRGLGSYELWYWQRTLKGKARINEAVADETVRTLFDAASGRVFRRVKHFSGISISSGMACDETAGDPDCVPSASGEY